jgi:hypothetical protein
MSVDFFEVYVILWFESIVGVIGEYLLDFYSLACVSVVSVCVVAFYSSGFSNDEMTCPTDVLDAETTSEVVGG